MAKERPAPYNLRPVSIREQSAAIDGLKKLFANWGTDNVLVMLAIVFDDAASKDTIISPRLRTLSEVLMNMALAEAGPRMVLAPSSQPLLKELANQLEHADRYRRQGAEALDNREMERVKTNQKLEEQCLINAGRLVAQMSVAEQMGVSKVDGPEATPQTDRPLATMREQLMFQAKSAQVIVNDPVAINQSRGIRMVSDHLQNIVEAIEHLPKAEHQKRLPTELQRQRIRENMQSCRSSITSIMEYGDKTTPSHARTALEQLNLAEEKLSALSLEWLEPPAQSTAGAQDVAAAITLVRNALDDSNKHLNVVTDVINLMGGDPIKAARKEVGIVRDGLNNAWEALKKLDDWAGNPDAFAVRNISNAVADLINDVNKLRSDEFLPDVFASKLLQLESSMKLIHTATQNVLNAVDSVELRSNEVTVEPKPPKLFKCTVNPQLVSAKQLQFVNAVERCLELIVQEGEPQRNVMLEIDAQKLGKVFDLIQSPLDAARLELIADYVTSAKRHTEKVTSKSLGDNVTREIVHEASSASTLLVHAERWLTEAIKHHRSGEPLPQIAFVDDTALSMLKLVKRLLDKLHESAADALKKVRDAGGDAALLAATNQMESDLYTPCNHLHLAIERIEAGRK